MNPSINPVPAAPTEAPAVKKGLEGVVAGESHVGDVDGANCQLIYRGYNIDELVGKASYEEVAYLLWEGSLPTRAQLADWTQQLARCRALSHEILALMQALPKSAPPMAILRTVVSALALYDPEAEAEGPDANRRKGLRIMGAMPTIVAVFERLRHDQPIVAPRAELGLAANFLYMLHGRPPVPDDAAALDAYFVLLAEHSFNASTFTARTIVGTKSDIYSAIVGAIGALKGDLHGSANRKAMEMLDEIGTPENVETYVQKTLQAHNRFMGFGHRVYKGEDPRAKHLREIARKMGERRADLKYFDMSRRLQEAVWTAKQLYVNVDFYSASLLHYLGIPTDAFTTMFACARTAGWVAHILEQFADNRLIRPLAQYVGLRDLKYLPIDKRS